MIRNNKGLSLVELIIAIAIMSILSAVIFPAVIRYIDKSKKAMDVQTAQTIYYAVELAMTSGNDDAYEGWSVCGGLGNNYAGTYFVSADGHLVQDGRKKKISSEQSGQGVYEIRLVAWSRGAAYMNKDGETYENVLFKSSLDSGKDGDRQRAFTDEMLYCMAQEAGRGGFDSSNKKNRFFDSKDGLVMKYRYNKEIYDNGTKYKPECWQIYRRQDNGNPEIWVGYKIKGGINVPVVRIYPNTATEYK